MRTFYGIQINPIYEDNFLIWEIINMRKPPFPKDGKWYISLNERLVDSAIKEGVNKFLITNSKEIWLDVPTKKMLKKMEYEEKESKFDWGKKYRLYYFRI